MRWWGGGAYRNKAFSDISVAHVSIRSISGETKVHLHDALDEGEDGEHQAFYVGDWSEGVRARKHERRVPSNLLNKIADGLGTSGSWPLLVNTCRYLPYQSQNNHPCTLNPQLEAPHV